MKKPLGVLLALLALALLAHGGIPHKKRGQKVTFTVRLTPPPDVDGEVIVYVGECKSDPKPGREKGAEPPTWGCGQPDKEALFFTASAPVVAKQAEAKVEVAMPGSDLPIDQRELTLKVLYVLFQAPSSPAVELDPDGGDTRIIVDPPERGLGLPRKAEVGVGP